MLQDFESMSDHSGTLCTKELTINLPVTDPFSNTVNGV